MRIKRKGLRAFYEDGSLRGIDTAMAGKVGRTLRVLSQAQGPEDLGERAGWRLHPLKGGLAGRWSARVNRHWRVTFGFEVARRWRWTWRTTTEEVGMDDIDERLGPRVESTWLAAKVHAGEILRDWIEDNGATVAGTARRLGVSRATLNRVLAGQRPMTVRLALALEGIGWSWARFWMDLQTSHEIAKARQEADAA